MNDSVASGGDCDLIAMREERELSESVQRKRIAQQAAAHSISLEKRSDSEEIEWTEQQDVYRPTPVRTTEFIGLLEISDPPPIRHGVSLCFIKRAAIEAVQSHLQEDIRIELGGLLVGQAFFDLPGTQNSFGFETHVSAIT